MMKSDMLQETVHVIKQIAETLAASHQRLLALQKQSELAFVQSVVSRGVLTEAEAWHVLDQERSAVSAEFDRMISDDLRQMLANVRKDGIKWIEERGPIGDEQRAMLEELDAHLSTVQVSLCDLVCARPSVLQ